MANLTFHLHARVSSSSLDTVLPVLENIVGRAGVVREGVELLVDARMDGASAKDLNRSLLSALRRVEKRTRLRSEWTSADGTTYRFFDYVLKKTIPP